MSGYDRDPKYLHPLLRSQLANLLDYMSHALPEGITAKPISFHRTPADQLTLFKQGRKFVGGRWVVAESSKIVTYKDGYVNLSRHNYLPATAFDTGLFQGNDYLENSPYYTVVGDAAHHFQFDWGGDWAHFKDLPHIEIPLTRMFRASVQKDVALQWQKYLHHAGTYTGAMDGLFGPASAAALHEVTGSSDRSLQTWDALFAKFGPLEDLPL